MNRPIFAILLAGILVTSALAQDSFAFSGCSIDCVSPTLGSLEDGRVVIEKGLTINDQSFDVTGFSQSIPTQTLFVGQPVTVKLVVYENSGAKSLRYVSFTISDYKGERAQNDKARIAFMQNFDGTQKLDVLDQNGLLSNVKYNAVQVDSFTTVVTFTFDFQKPVETSAVVIDAWDDARSSMKNVLLDAIKVEDKSLEKIKQEKTTEKKMADKKEQAPKVEEQEDKKSDKSKDKAKKKPQVAKGKKKTKLKQQ